MAALPKPVPVPVSASEGLDPSAAEERDVHAVYESIAGHFARTRFKVRLRSRYQLVAVSVSETESGHRTDAIGAPSMLRRVRMNASFSHPEPTTTSVASS